jgi:hypothetical protein
MTQPAKDEDKAPARPLSALEQEAVSTIRGLGMSFSYLLGRLGTSPELDRARSKMDEAVDLAVRHVTR